jgi:hypothetical protein
MNQDAPRGWGWITNPKKAAYNRVYNRTSRGCMLTLVWLLGLPLLVLVAVLFLSSCSGDDVTNSTYVKPSIDYKGKFRKGYVRKSVSTNKNAVKNQNKSRYYYKTRGKYSRKSKD